MKKKQQMKSKPVAAGTENVDHEVTSSRETRARFKKAPSLEEIRRRAHQVFIERGGTPGRELDDWLQAERELVEKLNATKQPK
jgi:hypothetical protein